MRFTGLSANSSAANLIRRICGFFSKSISIQRIPKRLTSQEKIELRRAWSGAYIGKTSSKSKWLQEIEPVQCIDTAHLETGCK